ncbi:glucose-6-phosphatase 3 [Protopterus annectens]|uniref:glucose-6-phosphatase 3 n=1 Tax=Protopterus annectens TaxID=7888 RepID=UPI001CFBBE99|nr:glucose-6-phosphatase 3 [Protopterus annectens]
MEGLYIYGVQFAEKLQTGLQGLDGLLLAVSSLGDPKTSFLLFFPVTYFLHQRTGIAVLWTAVVSEWLNLVFKWLLFGERPFWWIHEANVYGTEQSQVQQFSLSCETGPGSPSGHAMVTGATLWVMTSSLSAFIYSHSSSLVLKVTPYGLYMLVLAAVGVSRIFILAHFPHQVVAGCFTGAALGFLSQWYVPEQKRLHFYITSSLGLLLSAVGFYWGLISLGVNLAWSVRLAKKWCSRAEWVRLETLPFSSLTRDTGAVLGLGLALHCSLYTQIQHWKLTVKQKAACGTLCLVILHIVECITLPKFSTTFFYFLFYLKYTFFPVVVIAVVPWLIYTMTEIKKKQ